MKKKMYILILLVLSIFSCEKDINADTEENGGNVASASSDEFINACSLNIRYSNDDDGVNNWSNRKQWVADFIYYYDIDIIGMQEEKDDQFEDINELLNDDYTAVGWASSSQPGYEYNGIYFNRDKFELLEAGRFWLSETPDEESVGWDAIYHRQVTWGKFEQYSTGKEFFFFNTHFSHVSDNARQNSARLLKNRIKAIAKGASVIVTGDFNVWPDTETYNILTQDQYSGEQLTETRKIATISYSANYTGHCFGECYEDGKIVDYVFVNDEVNVAKYGIITEQRQDVFLSDHYPVIAKVSFE